jgi:hypothetical protein
MTQMFYSTVVTQIYFAILCLFMLTRYADDASIIAGGTNETTERHLVCKNIRPVDHCWHAAGGCMCTKQSLTERDANTILHNARKHRRRWPKKIPKLKYWCEECEAWHLTSQPLDKKLKL